MGTWTVRADDGRELSVSADGKTVTVQDPTPGCDPLRFTTDSAQDLRRVLGLAIGEVEAS